MSNPNPSVSGRWMSELSPGGRSIVVSSSFGSIQTHSAFIFTYYLLPEDSLISSRCTLNLLRKLKTHIPNDLPTEHLHIPFSHNVNQKVSGRLFSSIVHACVTMYPQSLMLFNIQHLTASRSSCSPVMVSVSLNSSLHPDSQLTTNPPPPLQP